MNTPTGAPGAAEQVSVWRSRLDLSPSAQVSCANVDQLHHLVLTGFTPAPGMGRTPVLYAAQRATAPRSRATRGAAGPPRTILVQSPALPNWSGLEDDGLVVGTATQRVEQDYQAGDRVEIRIIANPAFRERDTGKRKAHVGAADQARWLSRRLVDNGLDTGPERVVPSAPAALTGRKKDGRRIHLVICDFIAQGTVVDTGLFHQALTHGVGHGKAYGCGLLLTRRLT